jgi:transglutaminase/protease-like cytokinesis protein 3
MKRLMIFICFISSFFIVAAQNVNEYNEVDRIILNIPSAETNSTDDIAVYIRKHFDSESKKIRAAYTWVSNNIKYDKDSIHRVILDEDRDQKVTFALRRRKGVCENFAAIFNDICTKSGITCFVVDGYTKANGFTYKEPHAWCVALVDKSWFFFDPTWDAGFANSGKQTNTNYFQILPVDFIQSHIPYDPLFQFLNNPVGYKKFFKGNTSTDESKDYFNYQDSIKAYENADSLSRYLSAFSRIERSGWPASMIDIKLKQIKLEIELIYQDTDMANYNNAVADYNDAVSEFNYFLNYRNNQFKPEKKETDVQEMFKNIEMKVTAASQKLNTVNNSKARLALDTGDLQKKLKDLLITLKEQKIFFQNYVSAIKR